MRRNRYISVVWVTALLISFVFTFSSPGSAAAAGPTTISISAPSQVEPGETFTIDIAVTPGEEIAGVQFDIAYNGPLVIADDVQEGNLLSQAGASTYFNQGTTGTGAIIGVAGVIITPGETVSGAGIFATITFTAGTGGDSCLFTLSNVVAGDINGQSLPVNVVNGQVDINQPPVLSPIGDKSVDEGGLIEFTVSAIDPGGDSLTYSALSLPTGASFNLQTGAFSWQPNFAQAGIYAGIRFEVSDGSLIDFEAISITVNQPYGDWDANSDGVTNVLDMIRIGQVWGDVGLNGWTREDVNEDGAINVLDMILIGQHWTG
jgi:hypothetical protein